MFDDILLGKYNTLPGIYGVGGRSRIKKWSEDDLSEDDC